MYTVAHEWKVNTQQDSFQLHLRESSGGLTLERDSENTIYSLLR